MSSKSVYIFAPSVSRTDGGIPSVAYYMAEYLKKDSDVYCYSVLGSSESIDGVKMYWPGTTGLIKKTFGNKKEFKKDLSLDKNERKLLVCMSWRYALVPYLLRKKGYKYVVLTHGNDILTSEKPSFKEKIENKLRRKILIRASKIIAISQYTKEQVSKLVPELESSITIIHPCSGEKVTLNLPSEKPEQYILSIGRLEERKGTALVVEAVARLKDKYPFLKYYIAGKGPFEEELRRTIEKTGTSDRCILLGRVSEDKKNELLDKASIFAMPSFYIPMQKSVEGFGIVYIEANAHGVPAIGARSGGIADAIVDGKTGILVGEKNVDELTDAIDKLLSGQIKINSGDCQKWAEDHYYTNIMASFDGLFDEVIG